MKLLLFFLIPVAFTFAQTMNYPDSLTINSGKTYPCFVKSIDESSVDIIYLNNVPSTGQLRSIKDITLEKLGKIYQDGSGFLFPLDTLKAFLSTRKVEKYVDLNKNKQAQSVSTDLNVKTDLPDPEKEKKSKSSVETNRWSFGFIYVPYYSVQAYNASQENPVQIYSFSNNTENTEGEFSYLLAEKLRLTLNIRYTSINTDERQESHSRDAVSGYKSDYGSEISRKLSLFNFDLGFKYYFASLFSQRASAFFIAGIGKQFASSESSIENLFITNPSPAIVESNQDEFLRDLNSPFHFNLGFGAEYSFNDFLSLVSNIRFYYSSISAKYDYRSVNGNMSNTQSREYKNSYVNTYVGVGLNFYF